MKRLLVWAFLTGIGCPLAAQIRYTDYVNPLVGTGASNTPASLKHGAGTELLANTIPAVAPPLAMTQWTPQTRFTETKCLAPYYYKDSVFTGFRGTHWLSGSCVQDYGSTTLMPMTGSLKTKGYGTPFAHRDETARPHQYTLALRQYNLTAELTATARCGLLKITAHADDTLYILVTPNSDRRQAAIGIEPETNTIFVENKVHRIYQGKGQPAGFSGYAVIQFDRPAAFWGTCAEKGTSPGNTYAANEADMGLYIGFIVRKGDVLHLKTGTSFTGREGALNNLKAELPGWDFKAVAEATRRAWEERLGLIDVQGTETRKQVFYTALYHALQHPRLFNDVDGTYPVFAGNYQQQRTTVGNYYDDMSLWDIYRAQLPLLEIIQPRVVADLVQSLILKSEQGGWTPNFPCWNSYTSAMVGDHGAAFIASAYQKGIRGYDAAKAYAFLRKNAFEIPDSAAYKDGRGRRSLASYLRHGYYPLEDSVKEAFHRMEQTSRTIEYAFDDYSVGTLAKALGKKEDAAILLARGLNYRKVFDPAVGFSNGRYADGRFYPDFDPDKKLFFITEGTSRQYTFYAPHDMEGLIGLFEGKQNFERQLDSLFAKGEYWHGNEPGHQIPFLYTYTNAPHKSDARVRQLLDDEYGTGPGGLSGNDDAGQMSAWYVFAAAGLYPVNPVGDTYALVAPIFDKISIQAGGKRPATITCRRATPNSRYLKSITVNGQLRRERVIGHRELTAGATIILELVDSL